jgi:hypothetical protein
MWFTYRTAAGRTAQCNARDRLKCDVKVSGRTIKLIIEAVDGEGRVRTCALTNVTTKTTSGTVASTQWPNGISSTSQTASSPVKGRLRPMHVRRLHYTEHRTTRGNEDINNCPEVRVYTHDKRMRVGDQAELANATTRQVVTELTGTVLLSASFATFANLRL